MMCNVVSDSDLKKTWYIYVFLFFKIKAQQQEIRLKMSDTCKYRSVYLMCIQSDIHIQRCSLKSIVFKCHGHPKMSPKITRKGKNCTFLWIYWQDKEDIQYFIQHFIQFLVDVALTNSMIY